MRLSKVFAGFAWLNWYTMTWLILCTNWLDYALTGLAWFAFLVIALIATFWGEIK